MLKLFKELTLSEKAGLVIWSVSYVAFMAYILKATKNELKEIEALDKMAEEEAQKIKDSLNWGYSFFWARENYMPFYEERGHVSHGYKNHSFSLHFRQWDEAKEEDIITPPWLFIFSRTNTPAFKFSKILKRGGIIWDDSKEISKLN